MLIMRRGLIFLLSCGVIFGYGGAIASARWHHQHGGCEGRWERGQYDDRFHHGPWGHPGYGSGEDRFGDERFAPPAPAAAPAPAPAPQTVVVSPAAAAPAPAPQIFVIMPGAQGQPYPVPAQVVVQPQTTTPAAAAVH